MFRLDVYLGERDTWGIGFSDNRIFQKQYYLQAVPDPELRLFLHTGEKFLGPRRDDRADRLLGAITHAAHDAEDVSVQACNLVEGEWRFDVKGTGFTGTFGVRLSKA